MASQNSTVLLNRLLSLKENLPLLLVLDSLAQSSHHLIEEFAFKSSCPIIYLSYETVNKPHYAASFIDCTALKPEQVVKSAKKELESHSSRALIIVDSFNYINSEDLAQFTSSMFAPGVSILGTYHTNIPEPKSELGYPSSQTLLSYIATSIFELEPLVSDEETIDDAIAKVSLPPGLNRQQFKVTLTNRRKSGRSLTYRFKMDIGSHTYEEIRVEETADPEDESLLRDLTTFNLTTNVKQKLAKEQVELPYMEAQESLGASGGAIVYEFEKDDDYDEEDPYEDPF